MRALKRVSGISAFAKAESHLVQRTTSGAIVTVLGVLTAVILFTSEVSILLRTQRLQEMGVDTTEQKLIRIMLNITFPALPCHLLSLDLADLATGYRNVGVEEEELEWAHNGVIHKFRLDRGGNHIGVHEYIKPKPYGGFHIEGVHSKDEADAMELAVNHHEGCNVYGSLNVQRVAGNFHISVHSQDFFLLRESQQEMVAAMKQQHLTARGFALPEGLGPDTTRVNVSHVIHHMAFGEHYPGQANPLDGFSRMVDVESGTFKYFMKLVPTTYISPSGKHMDTNQFSVTEYWSRISKGHMQMPSVFFIFDLAAINVTIRDKRGSFLHFLVRTCAVVGGVFAVTGMLDKWIHRLIVGFGSQQTRFD